jgi:hypothetical protein
VEENRRRSSSSLAILDVDEKGQERKPHPVGKVLFFVYQFVVLGPLFVFLELVCSYSGTKHGESAGQLFVSVGVCVWGGGGYFFHVFVFF